MFGNKKPTANDVIDAISMSFTKEELEKMGLENPVRDELKRWLTVCCGQMKPRFSIEESTSILLSSKNILDSHHEGKGLSGVFWVRYCYDNLFE